jgi:phospholipid/cholesterol/gamma-HCH transport system substrate-binding protein
VQKSAPSVGRVLTMVFFALSCGGLLLFLWLSFGGPVPLDPKGYRVKVDFPEATTLAEEADVRLAGVNVGKVKKKELNKGGATTTVELEIMEPYAPLREDTKATLRQKTLLGETYVELSPGSKDSEHVKEGSKLRPGTVKETVELDEILGVFDEDTKRYFRQWVQQSAEQINEAAAENADDPGLQPTGSAANNLNNALGNLPGFAADGADILRVLDDQEGAVRRLIRDTGFVFEALNRQRGALRNLIVNSNNTFEAIASRADALAETFEIFPTFLDESRFTLARLERFSRNTNPLITDLKPVADKLGPTVRDLGLLAPDLEQLFEDLRPLIRVADSDLPQAERFLRGAIPLFRALHVFLPELNPIIGYANYQQRILGNFLVAGAAATHYQLPSRKRGDPPKHLLAQLGIINDRSLAVQTTQPPYERARAYMLPNGYARGAQIGAPSEAFSCAHTVERGEVREPRRVGQPSGPAPPCILSPVDLWSSTMYPLLTKGRIGRRSSPGTLEGARPPSRQP